MPLQEHWTDSPRKKVSEYTYSTALSPFPSEMSGSAPQICRRPGRAVGGSHWWIAERKQKSSAMKLTSYCGDCVSH